MTQSDVGVAAADRFGLWYRFKALVVFNLLSIAGPAQLDTHNDPRAAVERDYERRRDLYRARHGLPPVVRATSANGGVDPVVVCAVGGALALVVLVAWAVLAR